MGDISGAQNLPAEIEGGVGNHCERNVGGVGTDRGKGQKGGSLVWRREFNLNIARSENFKIRERNTLRKSLSYKSVDDKWTNRLEGESGISGLDEEVGARAKVGRN